jgi:hypothetical protein
MNEDEPLVDEPRAALVECSLDDTRPNAAWEYANRRPATRGWGVYSGAWLKSLDDFGPHFTNDPAEAQCFNADAGAKRLGFLLLRYQIKQGIEIPVYVHRIPGGSR